MRLTTLEEAVLNAMADRNRSDAAAIRSQVGAVTVLRRENTGAGFYTYLKPSPSQILVTSRVVKNVFAKICSLNNPMVFLLFSDKGIIKMLEGAAIAEDTTAVDFSNVPFEILPDR